MSSSILNLFLQGDGMSGACSGSITSWPSIAVPLGLAHFPTKSFMITVLTAYIIRKILIILNIL